MARKPFEFDEIGYWSEIKLEIIKEYAKAYSTILTAQRRPTFTHIYIDGFAGRGIHVSKKTGDLVPGSPLNALFVDPPFREYYFIDLDRRKVKALEDIAAARKDVHVFHGDCNQILLQEVFPKVRFQDFRRGLCLLDPYGLDLNWKVVETAGRMRSIDIFLNFPVMDMNRNALWRNPEGVNKDAKAKMNAFWGDDSWRRIAYKPVQTLFGMEEEKVRNEEVAQAFRKRLKKVAGFKNIAHPMPMRNSKGAVVYYLFFASQKPVAENIVYAIFKKYSQQGDF